jgi:flagellar protein FlaG
MKITDVTSARSAAQATVARSSAQPVAAPAAPAVAPAPTLAGAPAMVSEKALNKSVEVVNQAFSRADEHLSFKVHKETNRIMVRLVDNKTEQVLREFPSEKFLDLVADLMKLAGLQVDETV